MIDLCVIDFLNESDTDTPADSAGLRPVYYELVLSVYFSSKVSIFCLALWDSFHVVAQLVE